MPPALGTARAIEKPPAVSEKEYVNMQRAGRIFGVSWTVIDRLVKCGFLRLIDYRPHGWKRVCYQSIVDHCDRLRLEYVIADRRSPLSSPMLRHKDEDLLPFPLRDTVSVSEIMPALALSTREAAIAIVREGKFEAYRLHPFAPWRISAPSFVAYLRRCGGGLPYGPGA